MNEDRQLTNFLRQHRSIAPPASSELEDRLMSTIEPLTTNKKRHIPRKWWRYLEIGIGTMFTGIVATAIYHVINPVPADIVNIHPLDLYLETHWHRLESNPVNINDDSMEELEAYLLQTDDDIEDI
jgi:hypothetical protein